MRKIILIVAVVFSSCNGNVQDLGFSKNNYTIKEIVSKLRQVDDLLGRKKVRLDFDKSNQNAIAILPDTSYIENDRITNLHISIDNKLEIDHLGMDTTQFLPLKNLLVDISILFKKTDYTEMHWRSHDNVIFTYDDKYQCLLYSFNQSHSGSEIPVGIFSIDTLKRNYLQNVRPSCKKIENNWYILYLNEMHGIN